MTKFTDEQLSRILGEHDAGQLRAGGASDWRHGWVYPQGCLNQVSYNEPKATDAWCKDPVSAVWFDNHYYHSMSPDEFLAKLESL